MTLQPYPGSPRAGGRKRFVRAKARVRSLQITSDVGGASTVFSASVKRRRGRIRQSVFGL